MSESGQVRKGWMAEKPLHTRRYHYISDTRALCGGWGFYFGELMADTGKAERGREDCAECFRRLRKRTPAPPDPGQEGR